MKMSNIKTGFNIPTFLIFIVFLVLKLTGVVSWSWWWITCPLWIPLGIFIVGLVSFGIAALITLIIAIIVELL
jgi:hypothetical protein